MWERERERREEWALGVPPTSSRHAIRSQPSLQARAACGRALCPPCLAATLQWRVAREGLPLLLGANHARPSLPPPPLVVVGLSGGPASRALWSLLTAAAAGPAHDPAGPAPPPRLRLRAVHVDEWVYGEDGAAVEDRRAALRGALCGATGAEVAVVGLERDAPSRPAVRALLRSSGPRGRPRLVRGLVRAALLREAGRVREEGTAAVVALATTTTAAAARLVSAAAAGCGLELAAEAEAFDAGPPGLGIPLVAPALGLAARDCALLCSLTGLALPALPPLPAAAAPSSSSSLARAAAAEAGVAFDFVARAVGRSRTSAASMVGAAARFAAPGTGADAAGAAEAGVRAPCALCAAPLEGEEGNTAPRACFACEESVLGEGGDTAGVWAAAPEGGVWGAEWLRREY